MGLNYPSINGFTRNDSVINPPVVKGTIAFFFRPNFTSGSSTAAILCAYSKSSATKGNIEIQHFTDNNMYVGFENGGLAGENRLIFADTGVFTTGIWAHHTLTWDASITTTSYLVNAVQVATTAVKPTGSFLCDQIGIGCWPTTTGQTSSAVGTISQWCSWNVVLSQVEIIALSNGMQPSKVRPGSIVHHYPLRLENTLSDTGLYKRYLTISGLTPPTLTVDAEKLWGRKPIILPMRGTITVPTSTFRKTASRIGTRTGTRQTWAA